MSYYNTYKSIENFTNNNNNKKKYILLGDSILKNDAYVANGKSVEQNLIEKNIDVSCFAEDNSKIVDIYSQIDKIPIKLNSPNTLFFLSVGGNDILDYYVVQNQDSRDISVLKPMFTSYKHIIKTIRTKFPNVKLYLLDIYYPDNLQFKQFHYIIKEWNNMLYTLANEQKNKIDGVLHISKELTQNKDFSFGIEPSSSGGNKIAELIINYY